MMGRAPITLVTAGEGDGGGGAPGSAARGPGGAGSTWLLRLVLILGLILMIVLAFLAAAAALVVAAVLVPVVVAWGLVRRAVGGGRTGAGVASAGLGFDSYEQSGATSDNVGRENVRVRRGDGVSPRHSAAGVQRSQ